jgi:hypothetical protein
MQRIRTFVILLPTITYIRDAIDLGFNRFWWVPSYGWLFSLGFLQTTGVHTQPYMRECDWSTSYTALWVSKASVPKLQLVAALDAVPCPVVVVDSLQLPLTSLLQPYMPTSDVACCLWTLCGFAFSWCLSHANGSVVCRLTLPYTGLDSFA